MDYTRLRGLGVTLAAVGLAASMPAMARDYVVNSAADPVDPTVMDGQLSLREAVMAASSNMAVGDAPAGDAEGDTITIGPVPYPLLAANGPLMITDDVVITGSAGSDINGSGATVQLLVVNAPGETVTLANLELTDGTAESGAALEILEGSAVVLNNVDVTDNIGTGLTRFDGGAIDNAGTLTINGGTLSGNSALAVGAEGGMGSGGAIINSGALTVDGASFTLNSARRAGGAIEQFGDTASMTLTTVTMTQNFAGPMPGNGGGVHITNGGSADVTGGSYSNNVADNEGGALWNGTGIMTVSMVEFADNEANGTDQFEGGGALFNNSGSLTVDQSDFSGNTALFGAGSGGAIFNGPAGDMGTTGGTLVVSNSTFTNNQASRAGGAIEDRSVGEVPMTPGGMDFPPLDPPGNLTLTSVTFTDNTAGINGGGLHITGPGSADITGLTATGNIAQREGGALWNGSGPMTVADSTITGNAANGPAGDDGGGGIFNQTGDITITGSTTLIADNTALGASGSGGGIFNNNGTISITDATIRGNVANRAGGGIEDLSNSAAPDMANPTITLSNVTLDGNSAGTNVGMVTDANPNPGNGGGLHITGQPGGTNGGYVIVTGSTITGNIATEGGGLWNFGGPSTLDVSGSSFTGNIANGTVAQNGGGALFNNGGIMNVSDSMLTMNTATEGSGSGGALLSDGGTVTISGSTFSGNTSNRAGGAIEITSNGGNPTELRLTEVTLDDNETLMAPGNGGGLHVSGGGNTTIVDRSTVSNNVAGREGGGLWNAGGSTMQVLNSTVFGNTSNGAPGGGGIFNNVDTSGTTPVGATTTTLNVTIAGNSAPSGPGGGVLTTADSVFEATNTLIGDNTAMTANDVSGTVAGGGYNLVEDIAGANVTGPSNVTGVDGGLDMDGLGMNGGPTQTVALSMGSPAIDVGLSSTCTGMAIGNVDQRGLMREDDCDIGAFEVVENPVATVGGTGASADADPVGADAGDSDVAALGFTVTAPAGEGLTVSGFSGTLDGTGNFDADISDVDVVLDANNNGVADLGEDVLPATVALNAATNTFEVTFSPARSVLAGNAENYVLAVDFNSTLASLAMPMLAGGSLLLLGLAGVSGLRRRKQLMLLGAMTAAVALSACDGDFKLTPVDGGAAGAPGATSSTFQFTLTAVNAQGATSGQMAQPAGLPLAGPVITVTTP